MKGRLIAAALAAALFAGEALAQTAPPWGPNDSPTGANWRAFWATKQDGPATGNFNPSVDDTYTLGAFGAAWQNIATYSLFAGNVVSTTYIQALGSAPTLTTGSCSGSSPAGGTAAGTFVAASCTGGTYVLSGLPTATNGWACFASDRTTTTDTLVETASTVSSATLKATTAASDVIQFRCDAY